MTNKIVHYNEKLYYGSIFYCLVSLSFSQMDSPNMKIHPIIHPTCRPGLMLPPLDPATKSAQRLCVGRYVFKTPDDFTTYILQLHLDFMATPIGILCLSKLRTVSKLQDCHSYPGISRWKGIIRVCYSMVCYRGGRLLLDSVINWPSLYHSFIDSSL